VHIKLVVDHFLRILLVEDDDAVREMARLVLDLAFADVPHEVLEAINGHAAVHSANTEQPDVIVLDMNMPDVSGLDVLRHIAAAPDHPPVIAWSADPFALRRALSLGAEAAFDKTEDMQVLVDAISACLPAQGAAPAV
jgi:two-component system response regulator EvgA